MTGEYKECALCGTHHPPERDHCPENKAHDSKTPPEAASLDPDDTGISNLTGVGAPMEQIGKEIDGRFTITDVLGEGGFAVVYEAKQHEMDDRIVALKMLQPKHAKDENIARRFHEEVKTVSKLEPHENIVTVFASGETTDDGLYLAMERLQGETLEDILKTGGAMPLERAAAIATDICNALTVLHSHGIIHRDIKPANIMIIEGRGNRPPRAKLLDFGIARNIHPEDDGLTQEGQIVGTLRYMSPEQCLGREEITTASDIYSLGLVLFEMLTGVHPYTGNSKTVGKLHASPTTNPPRFQSANPAGSVPEDVELFTRRALDKKTEGRPATAEEFSKQLRKALHKAHGEQPAGPTTPERPAPRSSGNASRRLTMTTAVLCALIAVVALAGWYILDEKAKRAQEEAKRAQEEAAREKIEGELKVCTAPFLEIKEMATEVLSALDEARSKAPLQARVKDLAAVEEYLKDNAVLWPLKGQKHCQKAPHSAEEEGAMKHRRQSASSFLHQAHLLVHGTISHKRVASRINDLTDKVKAAKSCARYPKVCSRTSPAPIKVAGKSRGDVEASARGSEEPSSQIRVSTLLTCQRPTSDGRYEPLTNCLDSKLRPTDEFRLHIERTPGTAVYVFQSDRAGHFNARRVPGRDGPIDSPWMSLGERTKSEALRIQVVATAAPPEWLENLRDATFEPIQGNLGPEAQTLRTQLTIAQLDAETDMSDTPNVGDSITGTGRGLAVVDIALERDGNGSP
jgi:serine/threonine protein kinase